MSERSLRRGDVVEVRPPAEILATLDDQGRLESVPFMPEMLQYVGRRFTVSRRVEKICDTVGQTGSRRMYNTVYLEDLRCDGSGHGGCQAGCRIYWNEAWLRRVDGEDTAATDADSDAENELVHLAEAGTRTTRESQGEQVEAWCCQATEAFKASEPLKVSDLRQYSREVRSGNVRPLRFLMVVGRAFVMEVASRIGLIGKAPLTGDGQRVDARSQLGLQPGDLVRVRPPEEIARTLDADGLTRGLSFDREMLPHCGRTLRVQDRVQRLIDDRTGRMLEISGDCLILEGVVCTGERSIGRWFCPREIYPYWREAWLERVDEPASGVGAQEHAEADHVARAE